MEEDFATAEVFQVSTNIHYEKSRVKQATSVILIQSSQANNSQLTIKLLPKKHIHHILTWQFTVPHSTLTIPPHNHTLEPVNPSLSLLDIDSGDTSTSQQATRAHLQHLSAELRNIIYEPCLISPTPISFNKSIAYITCDQLGAASQPNIFSTFFEYQQRHENAILVPSPKALLDTCSQFRNEASGIYYANNTFEFPSATSFLAFASITPSGFLPMIPNVRLTMQASELDGSRATMSFLRTACMNFARLTHLEMRIDFAQVPSIYFLLGIPHLRTVELGAVIQLQKGDHIDQSRIRNLPGRNRRLKKLEAVVNQALSKRA